MSSCQNILTGHHHAVDQSSCNCGDYCVWPSCDSEQLHSVDAKSTRCAVTSQVQAWLCCKVSRLQQALQESSSGVAFQGMDELQLEAYCVAMLAEYVQEQWLTELREVQSVASQGAHLVSVLGLLVACNIHNQFGLAWVAVSMIIHDMHLFVTAVMCDATCLLRARTLRVMLLIKSACTLWLGSVVFA